MGLVFTTNNNGSVFRHGKDIVALGQRDFLSLIKNSRLCVICAQSSGSKSKEHIIPNWLIRKHNLSKERLKLPKGKTHLFGTYKIPCCAACNILLKNELEDPISKAFGEGFDKINQLASAGDPRLYAWMSFIYFKTHFKDTKLRLNLHQRKSAESIGEDIAWERFRRSHALARAYVFGVDIKRSAIGSIAAFKITNSDKFSGFQYFDEHDLPCTYLRDGEIALICAVNDLGVSNYVLQPYLDQLGKEISQYEMIAVLNEYNILGLRRYGAWTTEHEFDRSNGSIILDGNIKVPIGLRKIDPQLRRSGLHYLMTLFLDQTGAPESLKALILPQILSGSLSFIASEHMQSGNERLLEADWQAEYWGRQN